jgi:hypothetical protein
MPFIRRPSFDVHMCDTVSDVVGPTGNVGKRRRTPSSNSRITKVFSSIIVPRFHL